MAKRTGRTLIAAGCVLLLAAALLLFLNSREAKRAEEASQAALSGLHAALAERTPSPAATDAPAGDTLPTLTVDGYDYIGSLSIPSVGLELPVMAEWDEARLKKAPAASSAPLPGTTWSSPGTTTAVPSAAWAGWHLTV